MECLRQHLRLRLLQRQIGHDHNLPASEFRRQSTLQRRPVFPFRHAEAIPPRLRTEDRATMSPDRRTNGTRPRLTRMLLLPRLLAGSADFASTSRRGGPLTLTRLLHYDRFVNKRSMRLTTKYLLR